MNPRNSFAACSFLLAVTACGESATPTAPPAGSARPSAAVPGFDINTSWTPTTKQCGDKILAVGPFESYRIGNNQFVRIERLSEDTATLCKVAFVYTRVVGAPLPTAETYQESAVLRPMLRRQTCWAKGAGVGPDRPLWGEAQPFTAERELTLHLQANTDTIVADITGADVCSGGVLHLVLQRTPAMVQVGALKPMPVPFSR